MPASFSVPLDVIRKLGNGDPVTGVAVLRDALGGHVIERGEFVAADVLTEIGHGNALAGRRVLNKFVSQVRRQRP